MLIEVYIHVIKCYPGRISKIREILTRVKHCFVINSDTFSSSCRRVIELRLIKEPMFSPAWNPPEPRVTFSR